MKKQKTRTKLQVAETSDEWVRIQKEKDKIEKHENNGEKNEGNNNKKSLLTKKKITRLKEIDPKKNKARKLKQFLNSYANLIFNLIY